MFAILSENSDKNNGHQGVPHPVVRHPSSLSKSVFMNRGGYESGSITTAVSDTVLAMAIAGAMTTVAALSVVIDKEKVIDTVAAVLSSDAEVFEDMSRAAGMEGNKSAASKKVLMESERNHTRRRAAAQAAAKWDSLQHDKDLFIKKQRSIACKQELENEIKSAIDTNTSDLRSYDDGSESDYSQTDYDSNTGTYDDTDDPSTGEGSYTTETSEE